jgi:hypothetical protein
VLEKVGCGHGVRSLLLLDGDDEHVAGHGLTVCIEARGSDEPTREDKAVWAQVVQCRVRIRPAGV